MEKKYYHYAYLFVQNELKEIEKSIVNEPDVIIRKHLISRKNELEIDLKELERLIQ